MLAFLLGRKIKKALGIAFLDTAKSERRKPALVAPPGGRRTSSHTKRIMHGATTVSSSRERERDEEVSKLAWWRERTAEGGWATSEVLNTGRRPVDEWKRQHEYTSTCVPDHVSLSVTDTLTAAVYLLGVHNVSPPTTDNPKQAGGFPEDRSKRRRQ